MTQTPRPTPTPRPSNPPKNDLQQILEQFQGMVNPSAGDDAKPVWIANGQPTKTVKELSDTFVESVFNADDPNHGSAIKTYQTLFASGAFGTKPTKQSVYSGIRRIYLDAANVYNAGKGRKVNAMDNYRNNLAVIAQYSQSTGPKRVITTYTDQQATQLANDVFSQTFGRAPSANESSAFKKALIAAASAAPRVTTKTKTGVVQTGGFNQNAWIASYMSGLLPAEAKRAELGGSAGQWQDVVRQTMLDYGLTPDPAGVLNDVRDLVGGKLTKEAFLQRTQGQAKTKFGAAMAQAIDAGNTVSQVVQPFVSQYAQMMELNPDAVSVGDVAALASSEDGKNPRLLTENEFQMKVRQLPQWQRTSNAKGEAYDLSQSILKMFGLVK